MQNFRLEAELWDINVCRRLQGCRLDLGDEEKKKDEHMDRIFDGKSFIGLVLKGVLCKTLS